MSPEEYKAIREKLALTQGGLAARLGVSFVVIEKSTGKAVMETWNRGLALKINRERFDVLAIGDYLPTLSMSTH